MVVPPGKRVLVMQEPISILPESVYAKFRYRRSNTLCLVAEGPHGKPYAKLKIVTLAGLYQRIRAIISFNQEIAMSVLPNKLPPIRYDSEPILTRWQDCEELLSKVPPEVITAFVAERMGLCSTQT